MAYSDPTYYSSSEFRSPTGRQFEETMTNIIKHFVDEENNSRTKMGRTEMLEISAYSKEEDIKNGTDIMLRDSSGFFGHNGVIRFDMTHAFSKKNNMPFIKSDVDSFTVECLTGREYEFKYGIRIGNPHSNFEEPVIVLGFDMLPGELKRFEEDLGAQRQITEHLYEIMNMSNDMLQAFYYQTDPKTRKAMDADFDEDERPDVSLITFNPVYLTEAYRYAAPNWRLPEDTTLAKGARELLQQMAPSPAIERLNQKYEEQAFSKAVTDIDKNGSQKL